MRLTPRRTQWWVEQRQHGFLRFVLVRGVLLWGITTALLYCGLRSLTEPSFSFTGQLATALITFPVGGVLFGAFLWWLYEREYSR
jgi:hypothetical protein